MIDWDDMRVHPKKNDLRRHPDGHYVSREKERLHARQKYRAEHGIEELPAATTPTSRPAGPREGAGEEPS